MDLKRLKITRNDIIPIGLIAFTMISSILDIVSGRLNVALMGGITVMLVILLSGARKLWLEKMDAGLATIVLLFITISIYLSNRYNLYSRYFFHDILLHFSSGVIITLLANELLPFHLKKELKIHEKLVLLLLLSISAAGLWEIIEFFTDFIFKSDVQRNLIREWEIFYSDYQNPGLLDTMNDIINGTMGGLLGCFIIFIRRNKDICKKK